MMHAAVVGPFDPLIAVERGRGPPDSIATPFGTFGLMRRRADRAAARV